MKIFTECDAWGISSGATVCTSLKLCRVSERDQQWRKPQHPKVHTFRLRALVNYAGGLRAILLTTVRRTPACISRQGFNAL
jgi:hypothetical protein